MSKNSPTRGRVEHHPRGDFGPARVQRLRQYQVRDLFKYLSTGAGPLRGGNTEEGRDGEKRIACNFHLLHATDGGPCCKSSRCRRAPPYTAARAGRCDVPGGLGGPDPGSLVESVYHALLERIVTGRLAGETVISELALAQELGVSRTPVHDAVRQLAKDGLVTREGTRRARVAAFTADDVHEIFELRKYLEGPAAELAAGRLDRRQLAPLRAAAEALSADAGAADWVERWAEFDELFHRSIARACGNRRLAEDIDRYRLLHKGFNRISTDPASLRRALDEHLAILQALEARDAPRRGSG